MIRGAAVAAVVLAVFPLLVVLLAAAGGAVPGASPASPAGPSAGLAVAGIPADYLAWYTGAAGTCPGLPWPVLAGIGTVESGNGQSSAPGVHSGQNFAGAEGPMQFLPATFDRYAVNADPARPLSPYDPADAIYTAAAMLCADGARGGSKAGINRAVFAYNHAGWYVREVLSWAARYAAGAGAGTPPALSPGSPSPFPAPQSQASPAGSAAAPRQAAPRRRFRPAATA